MLRELTQRPGDPARRGRTLHPHVGEHDPPRERAQLQLVHEVVIGGAPRARDQADAERHRRQPQPRVLLEQAFGGQRAEHPLPVGGDAADGEHRIDGGHHELDAALRRIHREPAADPDVDVVAELGAGHVGERAVDGPTVVAEQHAVEPRLDPVVAPAFSTSAK